MGSVSVAMELVDPRDGGAVGGTFGPFQCEVVGVEFRPVWIVRDVLHKVTLFIVVRCAGRQMDGSGVIFERHSVDPVSKLG